MGWKIGVWWFDSQQGMEIFLFSAASRPVLERTQPPIQWVPRGVKQPGSEADHSSPSSTEVKNSWCHYLNPQYIFMM
jgi:hypothetical protein